MPDSDTGISPAIKYALLAFLVLLAGLGLAVLLGGDGQAPTAYEGFN